MSPGSCWMDRGKAPGSYAGRTAITTTDPTARTTFLVATQALAAEAAVIEIQFISGDNNMSDVTYVSKARIERKVGPVRIAYLPGESQPVTLSVHGDIAKHYKIDPRNLMRQPWTTSLRPLPVEWWARLEARWKHAKLMPATGD